MMKSPIVVLISVGLVVLAVLVPESAWAAEAGKAPANSGLADAETLTKIVGGILGGLLTLVGLPAAFLQFSKTRAEIKKLRLENSKLSHEVSEINEEQLENHAIRLNFDNSNDNVITIETAAGLSGPVLVIIDFIVSYILFQTYRILFGTLPFSGPLWNLIATVVTLGTFLLLFVPVYLNAREARLLLREVAQSRRSSSERVRDHAAGGEQAVA